MKGIKSYISILFLALLLFPIGEKLAHVHELLDEVHCDVKDKHYCQTEHTCAICDYVFSSSTNPPETQEQIILFAAKAEKFQTQVVVKIKLFTRFNRFLRGPPSLT